jgi:hypothetical protein
MPSLLLRIVALVVLLLPGLEFRHPAAAASFSSPGDSRSPPR